MKKIYVMAGVNGAGKTTFASSFFPKNVTYLNPDLMVKTFLENNQNGKKAKELDAWKHVVKKINAHINGEKTFGFETTLSDKTVIKKMHAAKKNGFEINLIYICLDDLELHFDRVDHRVKNGGHDIPKEIIARRFYSIPKNLPDAMDVADNILILNNTTSFDKIACIDQKKIIYQTLILPRQIEKSITSFKSKPENKKMKNMIICEDKKLPDTFEGFHTSDLLNTWKEIQGDGAKCSKDQIEAMGNLISEYQLGIFGAFDRKREEDKMKKIKN